MGIKHGVYNELINFTDSCEYYINGKECSKREWQRYERECQRYEVKEKRKRKLDDSTKIQDYINYQIAKAESKIKKQQMKIEIFKQQQQIKL